MGITRDMTNGNPIRQLLGFALPIFLSLIFQQLYSIVDSIIIGRFIGSQALAAIGATGTLDWLILGIAFNLTQGFSIQMSRHFGAKDMTQLHKDVSMSFVLCTVIAVVLCAGCTINTRTLLCWIRTPDDILADACVYLRIIFLCAPVMIMSNLTASILRALGDSRTPLWSMTTAVLVNIGLDLLFVAGCGMGVAGAAIATELANCASLTVNLLSLHKLGFLRIKWSDLKPNWLTIRALLACGCPLAIQNVITASGGMVVQMAVNGFGSSFVAGYTTGRKLMGMMEPLGSALGCAAMTFVSQNLGAGKLKRIRDGMRVCLRLAIGGALLLGLGVFLLREPLTALFLTDRGSVASRTAVEYLSVLCATMWMLYLLILFRSAVQGMGVGTALVVGGVMEFGIRMALITLLSPNGNPMLIYTVECFVWVLTGGMMACVYKTKLKKLENINQSAKQTMDG